MTRVVLDTNVLVSKVLAPHGMPAAIFAAWRSEHFELIISAALIQELQNTLNYDRIRRKYGVDDAIVDTLTTLLWQEAEIVAGEAAVSGAIPADPKDEQVLACAVDGQADLIVSGDRHLLDLGSFQGISILAPRAFLELLAGG